MNPLRVAVIGVGRLGGIHARALARLEGVRLVGLVDPIEASRLEAATVHGVPAYPSHRRLLGEIDAAVVATPTRFHHEVALDLLRHGIHLLVEKPLASNSAQAEDLVAAARRHGALLQVGHIERFNPALTAALPHLSEPKFISAERRGPFSFRSTDIGVVLDLMIHDIDVALSLARSTPKRVDALGIALFGEHEDVARARIEFENGCVAEFNASRASRDAARVMDVWSRRGAARLDFSARECTLVRPSEAILRRELNVDAMLPQEKSGQIEGFLDRHLPLERLTAEPCDQISAELRDFADGIRQGRPPRVTGEHGRDAIVLAEAILDSIARHAWEGTAEGARGPLVESAPRILRGPHWLQQPAPADRREAV